MTTIYDTDIRQVLADPTTLALIATLDENGIPHIEEKRTVTINDEGQFVVVEEQEHSRTNLNLVRSIWFNRRAVLYLLGKYRRFEIILKPHKVHISGPIFESFYRQVQEESPNNELSGVWILHPERVTEETTDVRIERENAGRIPLTHLDRIAKKT